MRKHQFASISEHVPARKVKNFRSILSVLFLDNVGLSISYPIFTSLLLLSTNHLLPATTPLPTRLILLGLLIAAFPLAQLIGAPFIHSYADTKRKKTTLLTSLVGEGIGFLLSGIAIEMDSYQFLLFSRFFSGFFAGNIVLCFDLIKEMLPNSRETSQDFSLVGIIAGIGFVIAIVVGGILSNQMIASVFRPSFPFWLLTVLTGTTLWISCAYSEENKEKISGHTHNIGFLARAKAALFAYGHKLSYAFTNSFLRQIYLCFFCFMLGWTISLQFLVTMLIEHFQPSRLTVMNTLGAVGASWLISSLYLGRKISKLLSAHTLLLISMLGLICGLLFASRTNSYTLFLPLMALSSFFAALIWTQSFDYMKKSIPQTLGSSLLHINQSVAIFAMTFAPLFGALIGRVDSRMIYSIAIVFVSISFVLFVFRKKTLLNKK